MKTYIVALVLIVITFGCNQYNKNSMINNKYFLEGAEPKLIARNFSFTEGPATDNEGNVYFTDQPNNAIWKYGIDGKLTEFMNPSGRSNGMYFDNDGNLISCADEKNELWSIDQQKNVTILLKDHTGKRFNGPNDVWVHPNGGMYFTDPRYVREYWKLTGPQLDKENVYYLPKGAGSAIEVITNIKKPNGIIGTADGKILYVADIGDDKTYKYSINSDGKLSNEQLFCEMGSDGMTLDKYGNLYLTGKGVTVFDPTGKKIAQFDIPEDWTANVTFCGKNRDQLFVTASKGIYLVKQKNP